MWGKCALLLLHFLFFCSWLFAWHSLDKPQTKTNKADFIVIQPYINTFCLLDNGMTIKNFTDNKMEELGSQVSIKGNN